MKITCEEVHFLTTFIKRSDSLKTKLRTKRFSSRYEPPDTICLNTFQNAEHCFVIIYWNSELLLQDFFIKLLPAKNSLDKNLLNSNNTKHFQINVHLALVHILRSCRKEYCHGRAAFSVNSIGQLNVDQWNQTAQVKMKIVEPDFITNNWHSIKFEQYTKVLNWIKNKFYFRNMVCNLFVFKL